MPESCWMMPASHPPRERPMHAAHCVAIKLTVALSPLVEAADAEAEQEGAGARGGERLAMHIRWGKRACVVTAAPTRHRRPHTRTRLKTFARPNSPANASVAQSARTRKRDIAGELGLMCLKACVAARAFEQACCGEVLPCFAPSRTRWRGLYCAAVSAAAVAPSIKIRRPSD